MDGTCPGRWASLIGTRDVGRSQSSSTDRSPVDAVADELAASHARQVSRRQGGWFVRD